MFYVFHCVLGLYRIVVRILWDNKILQGRSPNQKKTLPGKFLNQGSGCMSSTSLIATLFIDLDFSESEGSSTHVTGSRILESRFYRIV